MSQTIQQLLSPETLLHTLALFACVILTACAQILLKIGASKEGRWISGYLNYSTFAGYTVFAVVTVLGVYAMQVIELKIATAWTGATYALVAIAAAVILKERLSKRRIFGPVLIVTGIIFFHI